MLLRLARSDDVNKIGGHPDIELPKPGLDPFFEADKVGAVLRLIRNVYENPHQVVAKDMVLPLPQPSNGLRLTRDGAESLT